MVNCVDILGENFHMERGMSRPLKPAPKFVQGKKENDSDFMHRVELETQRVLMEAHIEEKYKVITSYGSSRLDIRRFFFFQ